MPTPEENCKYLYLVLTNGGPPIIDFTPVSEALNLSMGATTKRWSRLKQAMEAGKSPGSSTYEFLWLCVKHSTRSKAPDWNEIAKKCKTTAGAAAKRYSRMKQVFERGDSAPNTPEKDRSTPTTNTGLSKGKEDLITTRTTKRKRGAAAGGSAKKKAVKAENIYKPDVADEQDAEDGDDGPLEKKRKRPRRGGPRPMARRKPAKKQEPGVEYPATPDVNDHLPSVPLPSSKNPTKTTTFIKTDQEVYAEGMDQFGGVRDDESGNEQFYDSTEYLGQEEEAVAQERVHDWLDDVEEV